MTTYTMKRIPKKHLVQNVSTASNFLNIYFLGSKLVPCIWNEVLHISWNFIPKYFILDDLLRKKHFYGFYPCHMTAMIIWTCPTRFYFRLKLSPISGYCPWWLIFFKNCKEAMSIGWGQIRGALFDCFVVKKCPFLCLSDAALSFQNNPCLLLCS